MDWITTQHVLSSTSASNTATRNTIAGNTANNLTAGTPHGSPPVVVVVISDDEDEVPPVRQLLTPQSLTKNNNRRQQPAYDRSPTPARSSNNRRIQAIPFNLPRQRAQPKRRHHELDDGDNDVIIVRQRPALSARKRLRPEVIDLTSDRPMRPKPDPQASYYGHKDEDAIVVNPNPEAFRRDMRSLLGESTCSIAVRPAPPAPQRLPTPEVSVRVAETVSNIEGKDYLLQIPVEIRDKIYRLLLVSPKPIPVKSLWSEAIQSSTTRRSSRRGNVDESSFDFIIDARILRVCRQTAMEGARVLYSENSFRYLLRDPKVVDERRLQETAGRSTRVATRAQKISERNTIHLNRYGHLIRHMSLELESNRTGPEYKALLAAALGMLVKPTSFRLHTLTIAVSPLFERDNRDATPEDDGDDDTIANHRSLTVVDFFSRGSAITKALQGIHMSFLRVHVHVNSHLNDDDSSSEEEEDDDDAVRLPKPSKHHLETTLDLRLTKRHLETLRADGGLAVNDRVWVNDKLMREKQAREAEAAEDALGRLRRHIEEACLYPEAATRIFGIWENHEAAELRRQKQKEREDALFNEEGYVSCADSDSDSDADDEDSDENDDSDEEEEEEEDDESEGEDDEEGEMPKKFRSLVISIDRINGEWKAYRP
ncbi:hypothetical protein QBC35DRAFT_458718 [Podospora australis]|uniref:Uncharacterized protein n=1 Tax=Podospora australis TaxID=1536484 RepID=A0AAN6X6F4_9PEZI|nr:hypothetical protein QBC35DRAFT_458718 [Podospora australis]